MVEIKLYNNNAYNWYNEDNIYVIGYIIKDDNIYTDKQLVEYVNKVKSKEELKELLKEADGYYSIVMNNEKEVLLASDVVRSFPVFYQIINDKIIVSDDINYFENKKINEVNAELFIISGYVIEDNTLYDGIFQLEGAQILSIDKASKLIKKDYHFEYLYDIKQYSNEDSIIEQLDKVYDNAIKKMIGYLNGRRVVIPLSGGHDSRLIAYYLKRNGYTNIITYTYGRKNNPEAIISENVAKYLDLEWHFVEYKNKSMQKKYYNKASYSKMANYCARGFSVTHIQEWEVIDYLTKEGIIKKDDIIVPGFTGDFIAGGHLQEQKVNKSIYKVKDLKEYIISKHYSLYNWQKKDTNKQIEAKIWDKLRTKLKINQQETEDISVEKMNNLFERFDFEERQTKFICNALRTYDLYGIKWYMPLWDKKLMRFWLTIDLNKKVDRNFYYKFADKIYGDLTKSVPIAKIKQVKKLKNKLSRKIQNIVKGCTYYFNHFLNYYGYLKFRDYAKYCLKYGSGSYYCMFSCYYINYLRKKELKNEKS